MPHTTKGFSAECSSWLKRDSTCCRILLPDTATTSLVILDCKTLAGFFRHTAAPTILSQRSLHCIRQVFLLAPHLLNSALRTHGWSRAFGRWTEQQTDDVLDFIFKDSLSIRTPVHAFLTAACRWLEVTNELVVCYFCRLGVSTARVVRVDWDELSFRLEYIRSRDDIAYASPRSVCCYHTTLQETERYSAPCWWFELNLKLSDIIISVLIFGLHRWDHCCCSMISKCGVSSLTQSGRIALSMHTPWQAHRC